MATPAKEPASALQIEKMINSRLAGLGIIVSVSSEREMGWRADAIISPRSVAHPQLEVDRIAFELRKQYSLKK
jgi:hypothetical protein